LTKVGADLASSYKLEDEVKLQVRHGAGTTLEDRVSALEENFALLDKEVEEHRDDLDKSVADLGTEFRETQAELERQWREDKESERAFREDFVSLRWLGIGLFVVGAFASGAANVISCS